MPITSAQVLAAARERFLTDPEFHARAYMAAGLHAEDADTTAHFPEALRAASIALVIAELSMESLVAHG